MTPHSPSRLCPCQSGRSFAQCCAPYLEGQAAATPQQLMRSRYTAYVLRESAYVLSTWHPSTRPPTLNLPAPEQGGERWLGLTVRKARGDAVSFTARYQLGRQRLALRERSRFVQEDGRWYYLDGVEG